MDASRVDVVSATIDIHDRLLPGKSRAEVVAGVSAAAAVGEGYTVSTPSTSTVVLTWKHRPTWAVIVGIIGLFVFLLGALFFFVKETDVVTVTAVDVAGGVRVSAVGLGTPEMVEFLQGFLDPVDPF